MWNGYPCLSSLSQILQSSFNATYRDQTTMESSELGTIYISWGESFDLPSFFEIRQSLWHHEVKIGPKGTKFIYYIPTVIKKTNSITVVFSRLIIHFWDRFFKTVILWPIPNPSLLRHFNIRSKEIRICIYY